MAKRNWRKWLMRRAIGLVIGTALALGFFYYAKGVLSDRLLEKAKAVPAMIDIPPPELTEAQAIITVAHDPAFDVAFNPKALMGEVFDIDAYKDELFKQAVSEARRRGRPELAAAFEAGPEKVEIGLGTR